MNPTRFSCRPVVSFALSCALSCLAPLAAVVAEPAKTTKPAARPAATKPIEPLLSRNELRECMTRQDKLRDQNGEATRLQTELEQEKAGLLKDGEALKAELAALDRADAAAVEGYNTRAKARDQRIDAFEPRLTEFNAKVQALNTERAAFKRDCENRKFDEKDEKALQGKP